MCIYLVILRQFESSRNYKDFKVQFPEYFRCSFKIYGSEIFAGSSLHHIFESASVICRLRTMGKMQTACKMQTADCRLRVKCRLG